MGINTEVVAVNEKLLERFPYYCNHNHYYDKAHEIEKRPLYHEHRNGINKIILIGPSPNTKYHTLICGTKQECIDGLRENAFEKASEILYKYYYEWYAKMLTIMAERGTHNTATEILNRSDVLQQANGAFVSSAEPLEVTFVRCRGTYKDDPEVVATIKMDEDIELR